MATIQQGKTTFTLLDELQAKHPELIKLILATESMDDSERQYWFDILPSMNDDQVKRLYDILETEKKKLDELEQKYQKEIESLNEKHTTEWQALEMKKQKEAIAAKEAADANTKQEDATAVLGNW
jgi:predicted ribosome quality control (RQC) complex YloA/Tae2 family protein